MSIRLSDGSSTEYQLTPFTTIQQSPVRITSVVVPLNTNTQSNSCNTVSDAVILTISDLRAENEKTKANIVCSIQLLCASSKEGEEWCYSVQNNVCVLTMSMFEAKLSTAKKVSRSESVDSQTSITSNNSSNSNGNDTSPTVLITESIQRAVVEEKRQHLRRSSLLETGTNQDNTEEQNVCCCGYLIRKNHIGSQFYLKPSIAFAILSPKHRQVIFHRSHEADKIADVIACKVNALIENVRVEEVKGNWLAISLTVENQTREVFVTSDSEQKQLWLSGMKKYLESSSSDTTTAPPPSTTISSTSVEVKTTVASPTIEKLSVDNNNIYATTVIHSSSDDDDESDDDEDQDNTLFDGISGDGTMVIHGGTMVIHGEGTVMIHGDDDDPFSSTRVHEDSNWEEPNIFGKARGNIFQSSFWHEPEEVSALSDRNSNTIREDSSSLLALVQELRSRLASVESECSELREQLTSSDETIKLLHEENTMLKARLSSYSD